MKPPARTPDPYFVMLGRLLWGQLMLATFDGDLVVSLIIERGDRARALRAKPKPETPCASCGGAAHEATGHRWRDKVLVCGPCAAPFLHVASAAHAGSEGPVVLRRSCEMEKRGDR